MKQSLVSHHNRHLRPNTTTTPSIRSSSFHSLSSSPSRHFISTQPLSRKPVSRPSLQSHQHRPSSIQSVSSVPSSYSRRLMATTQDEKSRSAPPQAETETATLGIGCYWGTEHYYRKHFASLFPDSIVDVKVGFMGGAVADPSYRQVCTGTTDHVEVAQIIFNPKKADYSDLLKFMFTIHDPTTLNRQINDEGTQYASVIFTHSQRQKEIAQKLVSYMETRTNPSDASLSIPFLRANRAYEDTHVTTQIRDAETFYTAEEAHQMYLIRNPDGYCNHSIRFNWDDAFEHDFVSKTGGIPDKTNAPSNDGSTSIH